MRFKEYEFKDEHSLEEKKQVIKANNGKMALVQDAMDVIVNNYYVGKIICGPKDETNYLLEEEDGTRIMVFRSLEKLSIESD